MAKDSYLSGVNQGEQCVYPAASKSDADLLDTANWIGRGPDGVAERKNSADKSFRDAEDK